MKKYSLTTLVFLAVTSSVLSAVVTLKLTDHPDNHWGAGDLKKLTELGIVHGYPDGKFRGTQPATRYEVVSMIHNLYEYCEDRYSKNDHIHIKE